MNKTSARHEGFTLVELIVVIAIIGILASILLPAMIGYIKDARLSSANASAKSVYNAVMSITQKCQNNGNPIKECAEGTSYIVVLNNCGEPDAPSAKDYDLSATTGETGSAEDVLQRAIESSLNADANDSIASVVIGAKGFPTGVAWAKNSHDNYVGAFPDPAEKTTDGGIENYVFD